MVDGGIADGLVVALLVACRRALLNLIESRFLGTANDTLSILSKMKNHSPVRVVLAAYNRPQYLPLAIEGILNQSFRDFQFIVVDDGSANDDIREITAGYHDDRLMYIRQDNTGLAGARNFGARHEIGGYDYICFADDDDISLPHRIAEQYEFLQAHPDYSAVSCQKIFIDEAGKKIKRNKSDGAGFEDCMPIGPALFIRHEAFSNVGGFRPWFRYTEDMDFALRFSVNHKTAMLRKNLIQYRFQRGNSSGTVNAWRYYCAALYSDFCRRNGESDPVEENMPLDEIMQNMAQFSSQKSSPIYRQTLKFGMGNARYMIREGGGEQLLILLKEMNGTIGLQPHSKRILMRYAFLKGKRNLIPLINRV